MTIWETGSSQVITWNFPDVLSNVKIELSRDNGSSWESIIDSTPNTGSYNYIVSGASTTTALIKISGLTYTDYVDGSTIDFSDVIAISPSVFTISNSSSLWQIGTVKQIIWNFPDVLSDVKIELSRNSGIAWEYVISNTPNSGSYYWTVSGPVTDYALVRVSGLVYIDASDGSTIDFTDIVAQSNAVFSITNSSTTAIPTTPAPTTTPAPIYELIPDPNFYKYVIELENADLSYIGDNDFSFYITSGRAYDVDSYVSSIPNLQNNIGGGWYEN